MSKVRDGAFLCDQCRHREAIWRCMICEETTCIDCRGVHEDSHREEPPDAR